MPIARSSHRIASREELIAKAKERLLRHGLPRLQMSLILALTGASGFLSSFVLLQFGLDAMAVRYPIAVLVAYAVFLLLLQIWLKFQRDDWEGEGLDLLEVPFSSGGSGGGSGGGGGGCGGGGGGGGGGARPAGASGLVRGRGWRSGRRRRRLQQWWRTVRWRWRVRLLRGADRGPLRPARPPARPPHAGRPRGGGGGGPRAGARPAAGRPPPPPRGGPVGAPPPPPPPPSRAPHAVKSSGGGG